MRALLLSLALAATACASSALPTGPDSPASVDARVATEPAPSKVLAPDFDPDAVAPAPSAAPAADDHAHHHGDAR